MICARYARLSKKGRRQDDKAASIERQLQDAERFILANHLGAVTEGTVYAEPEGTSGAAYGTRKDGVSRRPAWDAMMADAAAQKFGAVVMMTPDRGSREMFKGGAAFFELYETGCAIYFYDRGPEPLDLSDPTKKLMFTRAGKAPLKDRPQRRSVAGRLWDEPSERRTPGRTQLACAVLEPRRPHGVVPGQPA